MVQPAATQAFLDGISQENKPPKALGSDSLNDECPISISGPPMLSVPSLYSPTDAGPSLSKAIPFDLPHHGNSGDLTTSAGMGLPVEIWLYIIAFLARDAVSLLACALTCHYFRYPAQLMINKLRERTIDANGYDELNNLVDEILRSPKHGVAIRSLNIVGRTNDSIPVVLSVVPIRLSRMLVSLQKLILEKFTVDTQPYPSRWMLYGRVFPNITSLKLTFIQFPSFKDFVVLVTSFPALVALCLTYPRLGRADFCPGVLKHFNRQKFSIHELTLQDRNDSSFLATFVHWMIWRDAQVRKLRILQCVPSEPGQRLLRHLRNGLQELSVHYMATPGSVFEAQQEHRKTEPFCIEYPSLASISVYSINERDIPGLSSLLPYIIPSLQTFTLWVSPNAKMFNEFIWQRLDAIICSWFMVKHTHYKTKLALRYLAWLGDKGCSVETLFPLTTSLGKGSWCSISD
ncbi:hypothetical protein NLI96_g8739 [Meripilus lineatus]|uniref:F-box domain-containing protein n=1 Tax=Meripilus lineatus TaxID=2056292 RepID=A0AAD5UYE3_9APHY|nr:hypothetical protein NLI96_g8739 [Physisporinus lineatus]